MGGLCGSDMRRRVCVCQRCTCCTQPSCKRHHAQAAVGPSWRPHLQAFLITDEKTGKIDFVGNRTECALLLMLQKEWGQDYKALRDMHHAATVGACRASGLEL